MRYTSWRHGGSVVCALLLYATTIIAIDVKGSENLVAAQTYVDTLIAEYVGIERMLWQRIENRADNVLLQVYKNHETFFDRMLAYGGSGALSRDLISNLETLKNIEANINSTAELGQTHLKEQILDRTDIVDYATTALKILKDASNLYEYAVQDDLWQNIISVCMGFIHMPVRCEMFHTMYTRILLENTLLPHLPHPSTHMWNDLSIKHNVSFIISFIVEFNAMLCERRHSPIIPSSCLRFL